MSIFLEIRGGGTTSTGLQVEEKSATFTYKSRFCLLAAGDIQPMDLPSM